MIEIILAIGIANYQVFINIPVAYQDFFGAHNTPINVHFGDWQNAPIVATVNRTYNPNHSPRIMMGIQYTQWVQAIHNIGDALVVTINSPLYPNSILLQ